MNEIGSEFWLEREPEPLPFRNGCFVLSGRTAIDLIIQDIQKTRPVRKVYMPAWACDSMIDPFLRREVTVKLYDIGFSECLHADIDCDEETDILYVTNYFGYDNTPPLETVRKFKDKGAVILYDRTHSFLKEEDTLRDVADYCFASIRKWMGVIAGAVVEGVGEWPLKPYPYLPCKEKAMRIKKTFIETDNTIDKQTFLSLYGEFAHHLTEDYRNYEMDGFSYALYRSEDFASMRRRRRENARYLHEHLKGFNNRRMQMVTFICEDADDYSVPLFVPVLFDSKQQRDDARNLLLKAQIYCPVHWPKNQLIASDMQANLIFDRELSLVCDQRYGLREMQRIVDILSPFLKENKQL